MKVIREIPHLNQSASSVLFLNGETLEGILRNLDKISSPQSSLKLVRVGFGDSFCRTV